jgi:plasmid stabilization system protein ParE
MLNCSSPSSSRSTRHKVLLTPQVKQDIEAAYLYIRADAPETARRWRMGLLELIRTLSALPERHEIAAEARDVGVELRQMLYGNYRILYTVDAKVVHVHALRHGGRRPLRPDEAPGQS